MIEDVYEPLTRYRDEFREKFSRLTREKFEELTRASGIDVEANRRQCARIHALEKKLESAKSRRAGLGCLMALAYTAAAAGVAFACLSGSEHAEALAGGIAGGCGALGLAIWITSLFSRAGKAVERLKKEIADAIEVAREQMEALNRLYTWDITPRLVEAAVPRLAFDPYFTARRLEDLQRLYGWDDAFNRGKSIVYAQSGVINGNPFLFGDYLEQRWTNETYTGSLDIEWEDLERDAKGNLRLVTRRQTLTAHVEKPKPVYGRRKVLIYGNDAAPDLEFSREPSELSGARAGILTSLRKSWQLARLRRYSQNLDDDSQYTLMGNHEFETLFVTKDRTNEVEYRLLFTALAQTQMLALLKDTSVGYGDDFSFLKRRKINMIHAKHLDEGTLDTAPERFRDWDYDRAAANFRSFNERYFKDVYFALAPFLAIPLYQQTRNHEEIWKGVIDSEPAAFWEHEATANYYGGERFAHPDSITENILKTRVVNRADGECHVEVTAHGFRGEDRVDYVEVWGRDGNCHDVPVEWVEYLPVRRTSDMTMAGCERAPEAFRRKFKVSPASAVRRSILSYLGR